MSTATRHSELIRLNRNKNLGIDSLRKQAIASLVTPPIKSISHRIGADISTRLAYKAYIEKYIDSMNITNGQCINLKTITHHEKERNKKPDSYELTNLMVGNKIILKERIGTESSNGAVYLTIGKSKMIAMASKLMSLESMNVDEINYLKKLSHMAETGVSPNLPLLYKSINCTVPCKNMTSSPIKCPIFTNKPYYMLLNELASGDLKMWLKQKHTDKEIFNAMQQTLLSLAVLHSVGISHCDAHYGNFLYHTIPKTKNQFWWYKINDKDYYVQNLGFLFVTWDFGFTTNHGNECTYGVVASPANDVIKLMSSYIHAYTKFKTISKFAIKPAEEFKTASYRFGALTSPDKSPIESMLRHILLDANNPLPKNAKIINKQPYTFSI